MENSVLCFYTALPLPLHDHAAEWCWRPLDAYQLQARVPRMDRPEHGVLQITVPWAEPRSRFTPMIERWIIDVREAHSGMSTQVLGS